MVTYPKYIILIVQYLSIVEDFKQTSVIKQMIEVYIYDIEWMPGCLKVIILQYNVLLCFAIFIIDLFIYLKA